MGSCRCRRVHHTSVHRVCTELVRGSATNGGHVAIVLHGRVVQVEGNFFFCTHCNGAIVDVGRPANRALQSQFLTWLAAEQVTSCPARQRIWGSHRRWKKQVLAMVFILKHSSSSRSSWRLIHLFYRAQCWAQLYSSCTSTSPTWWHWFLNPACWLTYMLTTPKYVAPVGQLTLTHSCQTSTSVSALLLTGCIPVVSNSTVTSCTTSRCQHRLPAAGPIISSSSIEPSSSARNLGVIIDLDLATVSCRRVGPQLVWLLQQCDGWATCHLTRHLQSVQIAAAWLIVGSGRSEHNGCAGQSSLASCSRVHPIQSRYTHLASSKWLCSSVHVVLLYPSHWRSAEIMSCPPPTTLQPHYFWKSPPPIIGTACHMLMMFGPCIKTFFFFFSYPGIVIVELGLACVDSLSLIIWRVYSLLPRSCFTKW